MSSRTINLDSRLYDYMLANSLREPAAFRSLRRATQKIRGRGMQISPEQGQFLALLVEMLGARRAIEIGTFTGYSALWIASALSGGGRLICCDVSAQWTAIARRYWKKAGLDKRIGLRLAPALETLDELIAAGEAGKFDFVFIDADKKNQAAYYERALTLLRRGGVVALDNMFWGGSVADPGDREPTTRALRAVARKIHRDRRVSCSLLPVGDGLFLARKR